MYYCHQPKNQGEKEEVNKTQMNRADWVNRNSNCIDMSQSANSIDHNMVIEDSNNNIKDVSNINNRYRSTERTSTCRNIDASNITGMAKTMHKVTSMNNSGMEYCVKGHMPQQYNIPGESKNTDDKEVHINNGSTKLNLNIGTWNVQGLKSKQRNKFNDPEFITILKEHDIMCLVETHCVAENDMVLPNYISYDAVRPKSKHETTNHGGVSILVKKSIKNGVELVYKCTDYIWIVLRSKFFGVEKDVYMCAVYIPPENSQYLKDKEDLLECISNDTVKYSKKGYVILAGDFNARTGNLLDHITNDSDKYMPQQDIHDIDLNMGSRNSQDKTVNTRGRELMQFCIESRLRILNGRFIGDSLGYFTCHKPNGSSVVDYIIMSEELTKRVKYSHVHKFTMHSDHCKLSTLLRTRHIEITPPKVTTNPIPLGFIWNNDKIPQFQEALNSPEVSAKVSEFMGKKFQNTWEDIQEATNSLNDIIYLAASKSLRKMNRPKKSMNKDKIWYNRSLKAMKKDLQKKALLLAHYPQEPGIRKAYFQGLKWYNQKRKLERKKFKAEMIDKLDNLRENSPKEYWKILELLKNGESDKPINIIDPATWYNYFKDLNNRGDTYNEQDLKGKIEQLENQPPNEEINKPISEKEISQAIKSLKNGKAKGVDCISNELLKYSEHKCLKLFHKLFNLSLSSGIYPYQWACGFITPIHKSGSPTDPGNYRGITITSCMGKLFNSILNSRLEKYLTEMNLISKLQIGFKKHSRTADHMFILRTLMEQYAKGNKRKLYTCFVDFEKAFDQIPHDSLFYKLLSLNINGPVYQLIKDMYRRTCLTVKVNNELTPAFKSNIGSRQGDPLSPNCFKIFTYDLPDSIGMECDPPTLGKIKVPCLLYADDVILLSETPGLQKAINNLQEYSKRWGLKVNLNKTKVLIFNAQGKKQTTSFKYESHILDNVQEYKYLGIIFNAAGTFTKAQEELYNKGTKAYFKLSKILTSERCSLSTYFSVFDSTVKPILLYGSEIWGTFNTQLQRIKNSKEFKIETGLEKVKAEVLNMRACRYVLGVHKKTSEIAVRGELGRYPLYVDIVCNMLKYFHRVQNDKASELLKEALACNIQMYNENKECWYKLDIPLEYIVNNDPKLWIRSVKTKLRKRFEGQWKNQMEGISNHINKPNKGPGKLRTYVLFKDNFRKEYYIDSIGNKGHRKALARFRTSAHKLKIEIGRYCRPITPVEERLCLACNEGKVEDEFHFLMECSHYNESRQNFFKKIMVSNIHFLASNPEDKFRWLLTNEDEDIIHELGKVIYEWFKKRDTL
jgi:exonuclease III